VSSFEPPSPWEPPAPGSTPPPPPPPGSAPSPPPGYTPTYDPAGGPGDFPRFAAKPPRPRSPVAGWLLIAGAAAIVVGTLLPWLRSPIGGSINAFDDYRFLADGDRYTIRPGPIFVGLAVVMAAFGIATLAARRILAVMILGIVCSAVGALFALGCVGLYGSTEYRLVPGSLGAGVPVVALGAVTCLGGSIVGCATRRR
jgi:hypothetical protein